MGTDDEREALAHLIDPNALEVDAYPWPLNAADRILAAGFHRQGQITEADDRTTVDLKMSIAAALHQADRTHKSRGCIGCDWCTLKSLLEGYNADEDIAEMREWLNDRETAFRKYREAEKRLGQITEAEINAGARALFASHVSNNWGNNAPEIWATCADMALSVLRAAEEARRG